MITIESKGEWKKTEKFLEKMTSGEIYKTLDRYGREGVSALRSATPRDSGATADAWSYEIMKKPDSYSIIWNNSNIVNGRPIAVLIQYGHGTGTGGWVEGRDYINPAIRPVFDRIANEAWKVVTSA